MRTTSYTKKPQAICALLAAATVAAAAPSLAHAMHAPADSTVAQLQTQPSSTELIQQDMLGPKYVTVHRSRAANADVAVGTGKPSGWEWSARTIGAGIAAAALVLLATAALLARRGRKRRQPEQRDLVGA